MIRLGMGMGIDGGGCCLDSDVQSFVSRSGITNPTQINAISTLAGSLKSNNLWNKFTAIYPFVGGTAGSHAVNLVSSSFTIIWIGTITHDSNGVRGDGSTGYGTTGISPGSTSSMTLNSSHGSIYVNITDTINGVQFGGPSTGATPQSFIFSLSTGGTTFWDCYGTNTGRLSGAVSGTTGFYLGSRTASNATAVYRNAASYLSGSGASETIMSSPIFILARSDSGAPQGFSNARIALASFGQGLSASEVTSFNTAVQTFQTTLGRS